jgi:O-antigen/teichoic acid export membrane protein
LIALAGSSVTVVLLLTRGLLARVLSEGPTFAGMMIPFALAIAPYAWLRFAASSLRGVRRFAASDALEGAAVPSMLVLLTLILGIRNLTHLADAYLAASVTVAAGGLASWFLILRGKPAGLEPVAPRDALTRSLPLAGTVLATLASPWIVTLFLAGAASTAEVGVYRVSLQFAQLLGFLLTAVEAGLSPQIAALHSQGKLAELAGAAKRLTLLLIVLGGIPSIILLIFTKTFLSLFGPEFPSGATAMRILIAAQMVNLATGPVGSFMVMSGLERASFRNAIMSMVLVLSISILLIPSLGTVGAAIAGGSAMVFRNLMATYIVWRRRGLFLPLGLVRDGAAA